MIAHTRRYAATSPAVSGLSASCAAQWVAVMDNPIEQFRNALADIGVILHPSETIRADGLLHRARSADDKPGRVSCWYRLHLDSPVAGAGGSWKSGASVRWCSKRESALTAKERQELAARILRERAEAQAETERRHTDAAARALRIWTGSAPANPNHAYLLKKQIAPGIARQHLGALVLPVQDFTGQLWGVQFIAPDSSKRFLSGMKKSGCYIPSGSVPDGTRPLWLAEGWATACTLSALQPNVCTIAACDAGNLRSVATEARRRWPALDIVIAGDFDSVGTAKGKDAAIAAHARILPPPARIPEGASDWNDWANHRRGVGHG